MLMFVTSSYQNAFTDSYLIYSWCYGTQSNSLLEDIYDYLLPEKLLGCVLVCNCIEKSRLKVHVLSTCMEQTSLS